MTRPSVNHDGFLIPNAGDVTNPRMAEPDRIDFNTLAHPLWGVIDNCLVTVSGTAASTPGGTVLVNGALITLSPGTIGLGIGGPQDRFDLIVATAGGVLTVVVGTPSDNPVFPDVPLNNTVLAAVFCPAGAPPAGGYSDNVIDKRKFISKSLLTKIDPNAALVQNLNGSGNHYLLGGDGRTTWEGDTWMWRSGPAELSVHKNLILEGTLTAGGDAIVTGDVRATGNVYGANLHWNTVAPSAPASPATIWQNSTTGKVYVWQNGAWQEMATTAAASPVGTVITSFEKPTVMVAMGWIPLDGRTVYENVVPTLFTVQGLAHLIINTSPRSMKLPDARKLVMMYDDSINAGLKVSTNAHNQIALAVENMPRHGHNPRSQVAGAATPAVSINRTGGHVHNVYGGAHLHDISDPGHQHNGFDMMGIGSPAICLVWGGQNKIDALFNDRNHTYSVDQLSWTKSAQTGITQTGTGRSDHVHYIDPNGDHTHTATVDGIPNHAHVMSEDLAGSGTAFDTTPEYLSVYTYVRS